MTEEAVQPTLAWYKEISTHVGLSPRCPYASVLQCPRFYQSLSLLGEAGSTPIETFKDEWLKQEWQKSDLWPVTDEQATMIAGPADETKHFWRFCPEVLFDRFGLFASDASRYSDEIDFDTAHRALSVRGVAPDDWRWQWSYVNPCHYTDCPLYSLIRDGKGRRHPIATFPDLGPPDRMTIHQFKTIDGDPCDAADIEALIKDIYEHPEIKTWEFYTKARNPHLEKAITEGRIASDTVEAHYYKHPDHELDFMKIHKNNAKSDGEKHIVATSPMYWKRVVTLTDRQRKRMEQVESQTFWDKCLRHPVFIFLAVLGSIASIAGLILWFWPKR
jgi:hypothetical protein